MTTSAEELLTVTEAAARARCTPDTIRAWIREGRLPNRKTPGGHFRLRPSELEAAMQESTPAPSEGSAA